jgi:hypothetical protein
MGTYIELRPLPVVSGLLSKTTSGVDGYESPSTFWIFVVRLEDCMYTMRRYVIGSTWLFEGLEQ